MPGGPSGGQDLSKRKLLDKNKIKRRAINLLRAKWNITPEFMEYGFANEKVNEFKDIIDILIDVIIDALLEDAVVFNANNGRRFGYIK